MNQYGRWAQQHWQEFRPERIADTDDPQAFFIELGGDVQDEAWVRWIAAGLAAPVAVGESCLKRVGRLQLMCHEVECEAEVVPEPVLRSLNGVGLDRGPQIGGCDGTKGFTSSTCLGAPLTPLALAMASTLGGVDHVG
ncbi:hypothetical protein [Streptomyces griseorubiginosus]|uniref:hypothetical protein n=1 Tax=Streptomyces griseorubiginosus TaxID=67304 RepID=UPI0036E098A8